MSKMIVERCQKVSVSALVGIKESPSVDINEQLIQLAGSRCYFGGTRQWFICPNCGKRVGMLYRRPFSTAFFCRSCQNLTYELTKYRRSPLEAFYKQLHEIL